MVAACLIYIGIIVFSSEKYTTRTYIAARGLKGSSICLFIDPPITTDEFAPAAVNGTLNKVCRGNYGGLKAWSLNLNVNRSYSFQSEVKHQTKERTKMSGLRGIKKFILRAVFGRHMSNGRRKTIPKILHFVWTDEIIPSIFVDNLRLFRKTHPSWKIHFWTLKAARNFIGEHEPQMLKIYENYAENIERADSFRYVLMYHFGGAYFDLDSKVLKPLDHLVEMYDCLVGPEPIENAVSILGMRSLLANSGFLCRPKHPFFRHVIDQIPYHGVKLPGPIYFTKSVNSLFFHLLDTESDWENNQTFELTVAPHDFFEYHVIKGVDNTMAQKCPPYKTHIQKYQLECLQTKRSTSLDCENMYKNVPRGNKNYFEACLEWISHGENKRKPSSNRFISHVHYGTKKFLNSLVFKTENNISRVLPDISVHM